MTLDEVESKLADRIADFFKEMDIDPVTGILKRNPQKRFNSCPYIGSNYCSCKKRILFIPLDIGEDEYYEENTYASFEQRRGKVEKQALNKFKAHIAGTYSTALYLLKEELGNEKAWDALWSNNKYTMAKAIRQSKPYLPADLMSYIAYFNRYSFVTVRRGHNKDNDGKLIKERSGGKDREWIDYSVEKEFLMDMIRILDPSIVIIHGKSGQEILNKKIIEYEGGKVFALSHPAYYQHKVGKLKYRANQLQYIESELRK